MLTFTCGSCRSTLRAPDEKAGGLVRCPHCKQTLRVPTPDDGSALVGAGASTSASQSAGTSIAPPAPPVNTAAGGFAQTPMRTQYGPSAGGRRYGFNCQYCSSRLEAQDSNAGQSGQCPTCGKDIIVPIMDRYGHLIDPMTGQVIKQDPHPVHAYAAAGERAPRIIRRSDGIQTIQCPRCRAASPISANNCGACGMPFTMEGTTVEQLGAGNGYSVASLVLGILGLPTYLCFAIPSILAIIFGVLGYVGSTKDGANGSGKGLSITGIAFGAIGCGFALLHFFNP